MHLMAVARVSHCSLSLSPRSSVAFLFLDETHATPGGAGKRNHASMTPLGTRFAFCLNGMWHEITNEVDTRSDRDCQSPQDPLFVS